MYTRQDFQWLNQYTQYYDTGEIWRIGNLEQMAFQILGKKIRNKFKIGVSARYNDAWDQHSQWWHGKNVNPTFSKKKYNICFEIRSIWMAESCPKKILSSMILKPHINIYDMGEKYHKLNQILNHLPFSPEKKSFSSFRIGFCDR